MEKLRNNKVEQYGRSTGWLVEQSPKLSSHQVQKREGSIARTQTKRKLGQVAISSRSLNQNNSNTRSRSMAFGRAAVSSAKQTHRIKER